MGKLTEDKKERGLKILSEHKDSRLLTHLNSCVHCGLCAESCIYYQSEKDPRFIPAKKVDIVASIYRKYNTMAGRIAPRLTGSRELNDDSVSEMVDLLFGACTMCGRCVPHCSVGVDITYVIRKGREMLSEMGYVPETLQSTINAALSTGNNMGISGQEFIETLEWLEDDLRMEVNNPEASIPLDRQGVNILYTLNPREPKFFPLSISAMAKIFYAAGESWTISTRMYDVTNYAYYSGNNGEAAIITRRLFDEMENLKAGECVLAECGHGSRAFRWEGPNYIREKYPFEVKTSIELIADYIREGRIRLDPEKNPLSITIHDPCNLARSGGIWKEQRFILKSAAKELIEMNPNGIDNLCCGGGGGQLAMSEYNERRMKIAGRKAEQIRATGAKVVAAPCHNCIDQLTQTNAAYKLNVQVKTIAEIVADALILD